MVLVGLAGCETVPPPSPVQLAALKVAVESHHEMWPTEFRRPFNASITYLGQNMPAEGTLDFHGWRDFRMSATGKGKLLFDARVNWAGFHVLRDGSGAVPDSVAGTICRDVSLALRPPDVVQLKPKGADLAGTCVDALGQTFTYRYGLDGRLKEKRVQLRAFDTLTIRYLAFDATGFPTSITIDRPHRLYTIAVSIH